MYSVVGGMVIENSIQYYEQGNLFNTSLLHQNLIILTHFRVSLS